MMEVSFSIIFNSRKYCFISDHRLRSTKFQMTMVCQQGPTTLTVLNTYKKESKLTSFVNPKLKSIGSVCLKHGVGII